MHFEWPFSTHLFHGPLQVRQSGLHEGEEHQLRAQLRQLDSRRASVERAGLMHLAVSGEGGVGGVMQGLRTLEAHVDAILDQEEAHASSSMSGKHLKTCPCSTAASVHMLPEQCHACLTSSRARRGLKSPASHHWSDVAPLRLSILRLSIL